MKTLIFNETNYSAYIFTNDKNVTVESNRIIVGEKDNPDFYIGDMNSSNATLHENIAPPADWQGNRYTFDGTAWVANPDWDDPNLS